MNKLTKKKEKECWSIVEEREFLTILNEQKDYTDWILISKLLKQVNVDKSPNKCYNKWKYNKKSNQIKERENIGQKLKKGNF